MIVRRRYRFRLAPTAEQAERLSAWRDALRWLHNVALEQYIAMGVRRCRVDRSWPGYYQQNRELTELRSMFPWLADVPRGMSAQVLMNLDAAWNRCWSSAGDRGAPQFKSKKRGDSVGMMFPDGNLYSIKMAPADDDARRRGRERIGIIDLPKIGRIEGVFYRTPHGKQKSCSLSFEHGEWWVSVLTEREVADPAPASGEPLAIDRGIALLIADSSGRVVENPRHAQVMRARLTRAQRTAKRRQKGSKNQEKARAKVARIHRRVARQREHVLHVESRRYARENHAVVFLEDLGVQRMTRSAKGTAESPGTRVAQKRGLNLSIADAGWGRFGEMLAYKVAERGGQVVKVPPAYSSQTCSACGVVDAASRRSQASFVCTACGHAENADVNAAKVLLARGLKKIAVESTVTACGGLPCKGRRRSRKLTLRGVKTLKSG